MLITTIIDYTLVFNSTFPDLPNLCASAALVANIKAFAAEISSANIVYVKALHVYHKYTTCHALKKYVIAGNDDRYLNMIANGTDGYVIVTALEMCHISRPLMV
jgi:dihydrodipicolinate synthase/N-acetylneuraminate lyase